MEKRECSCSVGVNVNWYSHYGKQYGDSLKKKKTKNKTTVWPSTTTSRHIPWRNQNWKRYIYPSVHYSTIYNSFRTWKQPRCSLTDDWIKKLCYIYTMEYYSAKKRNTFEEVLMRWMNLEPIIHNVVSQKNNYHILMHLYEI